MKMTLIALVATAAMVLPAAAQQTNSMSRSQIRTLQQDLNKKSDNPGPVDGIMGPRTRAALRKFQRQAGLKVTGQPTNSTLTKLGIKQGQASRMGANKRSASNKRRRNSGNQMQQNSKPSQNQSQPSGQQ